MSSHDDARYYLPCFLLCFVHVFLPRLSKKVGRTFPRHNKKRKSPIHHPEQDSHSHMTKLRFRIKQKAKKRSHTRTVAKRRNQRDEQNKAKKADDEKEHKDKTEFDQLLREAQEKQGVLSTNPSSVAAAQPGKKKGSKAMTRKQMKRKEKLREMGEAISDRLELKANDKVRRVKYRAQVRNSNVKN